MWSNGGDLMKKAAKYGVLGGVGCICIGVGIVGGIQIERMDRNKAQPTIKNIEETKEFTKDDSEVEIKSNTKQSQVSTKETIENDLYKENKILARDLQAEYIEKQKQQEKEREDINRQIREEYEKNNTSFLIETDGTNKISTYDYMNFDKELTQIARNEIYARYGYIFKQQKYQEIFNSKVWYVPTTKNIEDIHLSEADQYNVMCLKWWEEVNHDFKFSIECEGFTDCYRFNANQTFHMDLNNDGIEEEICYKCIEDEENEEYISELTINGTNEVSLQGNLEPYIWVVDVDPKDNYKELVIYDQGPSSDPVDSYYYYNGEQLVLMGEIEGHLNEHCYIENKVLHAVKRFDILGTQRYRWDYELTSEHTWKEVECYYKEVDVPIIAQQDINIYEQRSITSQSNLFKAGTDFTAIGTDLVQWIKVRLKDGSEGWINVQEYDSWELGGLVFVD